MAQYKAIPPFPRCLFLVVSVKIANYTPLGSGNVDEVSYLGFLLSKLPRSTSQIISERIS